MDAAEAICGTYKSGGRPARSAPSQATGDTIGHDVSRPDCLKIPDPRSG
jgi:hypothetical protein